MIIDEVTTFALGVKDAEGRLGVRLIQYMYTNK